MKEIITDLLQLMIQREASDLFLSADAPPYMKIRGVTRPVELPPSPAREGASKAAEPTVWPPLKHGASKAIAFGLMTPSQREEFERSKESNFAVTIGQTRFRANVYYQRGEVSLAIRMIKNNVRTLDELGLPLATEGLALLKRGLVLVVGAAGTGKSTTLSAMINHRAQRVDGHILTIENPIEFLFPHGRSLVEQREVGLDTESYSAALNNVMRQAPDVVMIDEISDLETARHAIMYAGSGLLCLTTMHANNANQAVNRLVNFFPDEARKQVLMNLSLNLSGVISQRLLTSRTGGTVLASEVLLQSAYGSSLIQKGALDELDDAIKKGAEKGMQLFDDCLLKLYKDGRISQDEALHYAGSRTDLGLKIKLANAAHF
jgi:twitching motility protein PilU